MEKRPSSFDFKNKTYKAEFKWSISPSQRPQKLIFSCPKQESHKSFILSKNEGMSICEDFQNSNILSELQTESLHMLCIDYSLSQDQIVVIGFNTGHILLMDPTKRKRGKVIWLNTRKNIYSPKPPKVCRWINENQFVVLFGDSHLWKFDRRLDGEDTDFIRAAPNTAKDSNAQILFFNHPSPKANPIAFWKLQLGKIRDVQVSPRTRGNLLGMITDEDLKIVDFNTSVLIVVLKSYFAGFQSLAWNPDGSLIVAGGEDDCIHVWNSRTWHLACKCVGHTSWISSLCCFVKDGENVIISAGQDGKLILWELDKSVEERVGNGELGVVEYPRKERWNVIEPSVDVRISEEPLQMVAVHGVNFFVLDMMGNLNMWS